VLDFDRTVLAATERAFSEQVTFNPASGGSQVTRGIFNDRFRETIFQNATELVETRQVLNVRTARFTTPPAQGDQFLIRGINYLVTNAEPDGFGDLRIYLRAASDADAARTPGPPIP
jgi:hypothetical protein